jgi:hypothetical protein
MARYSKMADGMPEVPKGFFDKPKKKKNKPKPKKTRVSNMAILPDVSKSSWSTQFGGGGGAGGLGYGKVGK